MQTNNIHNNPLRILSAFFENEERKVELSNYEEYFLKCIKKIKERVTNITNIQFRQTLVIISELKNSSIDSHREFVK